MKRIDELSKSEVLALTDEAIGQLIDLECAIDGVPLLPPKPEKTEVKKYEPDVMTCKVLDFYFTTPEDAALILDAFSKTNPHKVEYDGNYLRPLSTDDYYYPKIENKKVMSAEMYNTIKEDKKKSDKLMKEYESGKKLFDDIAKQMETYYKHVWGIVNDCRDEEWTKEKYRNEFKRYLTLSDNNSTIAWNFLINAHSDAAEIDGLHEELVRG